MPTNCFKKATVSLMSEVPVFNPEPEALVRPVCVCKFYETSQ